MNYLTFLMCIKYLLYKTAVFSSQFFKSAAGETNHDFDSWILTASSSVPYTFFFSDS